MTAIDKKGWTWKHQYGQMWGNVTGWYSYGGKTIKIPSGTILRHQHDITWQ